MTRLSTSATRTTRRAFFNITGTKNTIQTDSTCIRGSQVENFINQGRCGMRGYRHTNPISLRVSETKRRRYLSNMQ